MKPSNIEAATHCSSVLTPEILDQAKAMLAAQPAQQGQYFISTRVMLAFRSEFPVTTEIPKHLPAMLGWKFIEMPNQKADCLMITNPIIAKAYKNGTISEELLEKLCGPPTLPLKTEH